MPILGKANVPLPPGCCTFEQLASSSLQVFLARQDRSARFFFFFRKEKHTQRKNCSSPKGSEHLMTECLGEAFEAKHHLPATEAAARATRPVHPHHGDARCLPLFSPSLSIPSAPKLALSRLPPSSEQVYSLRPHPCFRRTSSFLGPTPSFPRISIFWKTYLFPKKAPTCVPTSRL